MRLPLAVPIMSRDGTLAKGSKLVNVYTEGKEGRVKVRSRPGISTAVNSLVGYGNGVFSNEIGVVDNTLFGLSNVCNVSSIYSVATYSTYVLPVPFYFKNEFYHLNGTHVPYGSGSTSIIFVKRPSISTGAWAVTAAVTTFGASLSIGSIAQARVLNGYVYIFGSQSPLRIVLKFSSTGTTWSTIGLPAAMDSSFPDIANWDYSAIFRDELWVFHSTRYAYSATPTVSSSWSTGTMTGIPANYSRAAITVLNSTFYMSGGVIASTSTYAAHVYHSSTGIAWSLLTADGGFTGRDRHAFEEWNGKLMIAGGDMASPDGSIWFSSNGKDWVQSVSTLPVYGGNVRSFSSPEAPILLGMQSTAASSTIHTFDTCDEAFKQVTISTISNPNNVPVDFIAA